MKPNKKQLEIIKLIKDEVSFWESTNDINSPSHYCSIDNVFLNTDDTLTASEELNIENNLTEILNVIKNIKE